MKPMSISEIRTLKDETDWERLRNMDDSEIDFSDIPPLEEDFFRNAVFRPPRIRKMVSIRLEEDILDWFRKMGPGYQTRIQSVLRYYVLMVQRAEKAEQLRSSVATPVKAKGKNGAATSKPEKRIVKPFAKRIAKGVASRTAKPRQKPRALTASKR